MSDKAAQRRLAIIVALDVVGYSARTIMLFRYRGHYTRSRAVIPVSLVSPWF